jgi:hypothetical protein
MWQLWQGYFFLNLSSESVPTDVKNVLPITPAEQAALGDRSRVGIEAVVFFTHLFDHSIELRYRKLKSDSGELAQIFILAPLGTSIPDQYSDETYFFDYDRMRSGAARVIGDQLIPGNVHLVALDFYRNHPGFDYYWFIEYDVVFTGNWATLLGAVQNDRADLLAAHIRSPAEEPGWPWWETLELPGCPLPQSDWLRAFFPVYRISREGLRAVDERVKLGWSGHFEGLIPCAIRTASLSISDLGGAGTWTPKDRRYRFYSSFSSTAGVSLNAGTHRHRPPHYFPRLRRNTIFHPVKVGSSEWKNGIVQFLKRHRVHELPVRCGVSLYYNLLSLWPVFRKKIK